MSGELVRVTGVTRRGQRFVAGVVVGERAAPILGSMWWWSAAQILDYCDRRGWRAELRG